ncbi:hypothetical protein HC928_21695 [bacterium]|nr:hypothetical protein [bacterium]
MATSQEYIDLLVAFPPRPIASDEALEETQEAIDSLARLMFKLQEQKR